MKLPKQKGFSLILAVLIVAALLAGGLYFSRSQKITSPAQLITSLPIPTPSPWNIYQGDGFEITYPKNGVIAQDHGYTEGECGTGIKEDPRDKSVLLFDNFFKIKEISWDKTLDEYLISTRAKNAYETDVLEGSGADEAIKLLKLKPGFEVAVGYPPLAFTKAVFKKGEKVYLLQSFNTITNFGGCVLPTIVDPVKYPEVSKSTWDPLTRIKFNP